MPLIKLENKTPAVYTQESRDFQLLCRLFDCIINGVKFDIDNMVNINNTMFTRGNILALLQTKVGFFTEYDINDDVMRYVLAGFPEIIRAKGSIKAIKEAINVFLKAHDIVGQITIWDSGESSETHGGISADDHTIIIGLDTVIKNIYVLEEIFRYIIPTGFGVRFYFYNNISELQKFVIENKAKLIFASNNINSILMQHINDDGTLRPVLKNPKDKFGTESIDMGYDSTITAVDTMGIISSLDGSNQAVTMQEANRFLGFFQEAPLNTKTGDYYGIIVDTEMSLYYNNGGTEPLAISYLGVYKDATKLPAVKNGDTWTLVDADNHFTHYMQLNGTATTNNALYALCMELISPDTELPLATINYKGAEEPKQINTNTKKFTQEIEPGEFSSSFGWDELNKKIWFKNIKESDQVSIYGSNIVDIVIKLGAECTFAGRTMPAVVRVDSNYIMFNPDENHKFVVEGKRYTNFDDIKAAQTGTFALSYQTIMEGDLLEKGNLYSYQLDGISYIVHCTKSGKFKAQEEAAEVEYVNLAIYALADFTKDGKILVTDEAGTILRYEPAKKTYVDKVGTFYDKVIIKRKGGEE